MKKSTKNKTCLVFYFGNGYTEREWSYINMYEYSVDMRDNRKNHEDKIFGPLRKKGYSIDISLVTNKHKNYDKFLKEYSAIKLDYEDITKEETKMLYDYYKLRVPQQYGPGFILSGARFLKIKDKIPEYDLYLFIRADLLFKKSVNDMDINYEKINYLWPESDDCFFNEKREDYIKMFGSEDFFWKSYNRINGNYFNVVPKKYINMFLAYYWTEHMSLHLMLKDFGPIISLENDFHIICGVEKFYSSNTRVCDNPIVKTSKKIYTLED